MARTIKLGGQHKGHAHCMMGKCNGGSRCCHRGPRGGEREGETADVSLPLSSCRSVELLCVRLFEAGKRGQQPYLLLKRGKRPSTAGRSDLCPSPLWSSVSVAMVICDPKVAEILKIHPSLKFFYLKKKKDIKALFMLSQRDS